MGFADQYFKRFGVSDLSLTDSIDFDPGIIVIIPALDEPDLLKCLSQLKCCCGHKSRIMIVVVINHSVVASNEIKQSNKKLWIDLKQFAVVNSTDHFIIRGIFLQDVSKRNAGVGFARKTGMDEAVRIFNCRNTDSGIIASLDADCEVEENYFAAIEDFFNNNIKLEAATIKYAHPLSGNDYPENIYNSVILYELYLRYFKNALHYTGYPHAIYTIGSCFALKAAAYIRAGGMNRRQGGEDFYFLHKLTEFVEIANINNTCVKPSPRISTRVPFGTGPAVRKITETGSWSVYNFELFRILKKFFSMFDLFYTMDDCEIETSISKLSISLSEFCDEIKFTSKINSLKSNTASLYSFRKKMFQLFNVFTIIRYLNKESEEQFPKQTPENASLELLLATGIKTESSNALDLLLYFRNIEN